MAEPQDDLTVIATVLDGNVDAFETLLKRYEQPVVKRIASHVPPQHVGEVAHQTFIRAFKSLGGYAPTSPFGNWLATIATRTCHDFWRKQYRSLESPACDLSEDGPAFLEAAMRADSMEEFERLAQSREARQLLDTLLAQLGPLDRMILTLTYLEERSVAETAELLEISPVNVKVRAYRAKRKLKSFLKRHGIQGGLHAS